MSLDDLLALLELAERAPKSKAEALWLAALAKNLRAQLEQPPPAPETKGEGQ